MGFLAAALPLAGSLASSFLSRGKPSSSSSYGRPLMGGELEEIYAQATRPGGATPGPSPELPPFQWDRLTGGDYDKLEMALSDIPTRRLAEDREQARARFEANMRRIGLADDPAAAKLMSETIDQPYGRQISDALSAAAGQRYGLQLGELQPYNQARLEYGLKPSEYWLNKMRTFYSGQGTMSGSQSTGGTASPFSQIDPFKLAGSITSLIKK